MCRQLRHRGPDDTGTYASGRVVLGMTRLSIIDVEGGTQPLSNEKETVWVVFNGEIYNYRELRIELERRGHAFRTMSDTEVLVHLYEECGIELLQRLNGMFAFALWDAERETLFLARDRLGIKPLFYSAVGGSLIFASELKAILEAEEIPAAVDLDAIAQYMALSYVPGPRTPFASVKKLPEASYLEYRDGRVRCDRFWQVPEPAESSLQRDGDLADELRELLRDAVRLQLRSDVPVGVFASGGVDSTAIMWAVSTLEVPVEAFVCEFDDLKVDTEFARLACATTGMTMSEHKLSQGDAGLLLPELVWYQDEPLGDPAIVPAYLISKAARERVKVILNGTGGDELFGGYPRYGLGAGGLQNLSALRWPLRALSGVVPGARRASAILDYRERYLRRMSVIDESEVRNALGLRQEAPVRDLFQDLFSRCRVADSASAMMYVDLHTYLPGDLLPLLDRTTMAASLEGRVPLLDHRLVEFAARLPGELKMRAGQSKWLLKHALRGHVSDGILDRTKQGFGPPIGSWMRGTFGDQALKLLSSPRSHVQRLFGSKALHAWLGHRPHGGLRHQRLWVLLVLELWWRTFVEKCDLTGVAIVDMVGDG
jgi:asparagine synthase (glutamine-hydrolysing)